MTIATTESQIFHKKLDLTNSNFLYQIIRTYEGEIIFSKVTEVDGRVILFEPLLFALGYNEVTDEEAPGLARYEPFSDDKFFELNPDDIRRVTSMSSHYVEEYRRRCSESYHSSFENSSDTSTHSPDTTLSPITDSLSKSLHLSENPSTSRSTDTIPKKLLH